MRHSHEPRSQEPKPLKETSPVAHIIMLIVFALILIVGGGIYALLKGL